MIPGVVQPLNDGNAESVFSIFSFFAPLFIAYSIFVVIVVVIISLFGLLMVTKWLLQLQALQLLMRKSLGLCI